MSIEAMVPQHLGVEFGYACELGAWDGTGYSNTLALEQRGWIVLCIEPNPGCEAAGRAARRLWRQIACGPADGEGRFLDAGGPSYSGLLTEDDCLPYVGKTRGEPIKVEVRTLDRVLEEAGFPRLDYLSLDVEGYELEVLAGFTIERWKPKVMTVERFMGRTMETPAGYIHIGRLAGQEDEVFVREEADATP